MQLRVKFTLLTNDILSINTNILSLYTQTNFPIFNIFRAPSKSSSLGKLLSNGISLFICCSCIKMSLGCSNVLQHIKLPLLFHLIIQFQIAHSFA
jgi:hypothetical protein